MKYVYEVINRQTIIDQEDEYWTFCETIAIFGSEEDATKYINKLINEFIYDKEDLVVRKSEIGKETNKESESEE